MLQVKVVLPNPSLHPTLRDEAAMRR